MTQKRAMLRLALAIHQQSSSQVAKSADFELPESAWHQCSCLIRRRRRARQKGWNLAAQSLERDLQSLLEDLQRRVSDVAQRATNHQRTRFASARDLYDDLLALHNEFSDVSWDPSEQTLAVTTGPIELEGVYLGPFKIVLRWQDREYSVVALDANPATVDDGVTHPHVQEETLCEGDGRHAVRSALQQGRLYDFFTLVHNILKTYNPSGPYVMLEHWHGATCSDCGCTASDGDRSDCESCGSTLCSDCYYCCEQCCSSRCSECSASCHTCGRRFCNGCQAECCACHASVCLDCIEDERCKDCYEKEDQTEDQDLESESENCDLPTDAALQPDGMGKAAVPA